MTEMFEPAERKGFDAVECTMHDRVRLIGPDDKSVKNDKGGAAFSNNEARRSLEGLPDGSAQHGSTG